jgi:hypothetical protein
MNRSLRMLLIVVAIIVVIGALGYLAHSMNLIGLLISMHTPPQH